MEGHSFVKLRITGENLDFEEIIQALSCQPSFTYRKGEHYTPKFGDKQPKVYKEDCLLFETEKQDDETIDDMLYKFLTGFTKSKEYINELSQKADITLWVSVYPDEEQSNIHLGNKTVKLLSDMGLSVDFNIMFLKDLYNGIYKREREENLNVR